MNGQYWELTKYEAQLKIIHRVCLRARTYFLDRKDTYGIDNFQHIEDEIERLALQIYEEELISQDHVEKILDVEVSGPRLSSEAS